MAASFTDRGLFAFAELLERLGQLRLKGCLRVETENLIGNVYLDNGHIMQAETKTKQGEQALLQMMNVPGARLSWFDSTSAGNPNMDLMVQQFLLQQRILDDEGGQDFNSSTMSGMIPNRLRVLQRRMPRFVLRLALNGDEILVGKLTSIVGRDPTCDITLAHPSISRRQAIVRLTEDGLHISDLGSTNGTYLNKEQIIETLARNGDLLTFGNLEVEVLSPSRDVYGSGVHTMGLKLSEEDRAEAEAKFGETSTAAS